MLKQLLGSESEGAEGGSSSSSSSTAKGGGGPAAAQTTLAALGASPADPTGPTAAVAADTAEQQAAAHADQQHGEQAAAATAPASPAARNGGTGSPTLGKEGAGPHSPASSQGQGRQTLELCSHGHRLSLLRFGSAEEVAVGRDVARVCEALDAGKRCCWRLFACSLPSL